MATSFKQILNVGIPGNTSCKHGNKNSNDRLNINTFDEKISEFNDM